MWSYLKSLALRTMLTLACLVFLTVNRPEPSTLAAPSGDVAYSAPFAGPIEMQVVPAPAVESRLPRGNLALARAEAAATPEPSIAKPAADPAEIVLFQAIIAQAESSQQRTNGPARSSGGPGGGPSGSTARRAPDPDLPPEFDPMYETWQKDADIKLKSEEARKLVKEHPLAVANPDSYLVICLGGCRPASDKIVYRVSKTAAAAAVIAARRMETTAAQVKTGAAIMPSEADQNAVACIAGCYANEEISPAMRPRLAEAAPKARPVRLAADVPAPKSKAAIALSGVHRISAETRGHFAKKRVTSVIRGTQGWRTKVTFVSKKSARFAAKRGKIKRIAASKLLRGRGARRNTIVTEASGFIF